jgi:hypothetical protein
VHKQVYIYGGLDPSPTVLTRNFGFAWSVGAWLLDAIGDLPKDQSTVPVDEEWITIEARVARCCPATRQANRSLTPRTRWSWRTAARAFAKTLICHRLLRSEAAQDPL